MAGEGGQHSSKGERGRGMGIAANRTTENIEDEINTRLMKKVEMRLSL